MICFRRALFPTLEGGQKVKSYRISNNIDSSVRHLTNLGILLAHHGWHLPNSSSCELTRPLGQLTWEYCWPTMGDTCPTVLAVNSLARCGNSSRRSPILCCSIPASRNITNLNDLCQICQLTLYWLCILSFHCPLTNVDAVLNYSKIRLGTSSSDQ